MQSKFSNIFHVSKSILYIYLIRSSLELTWNGCKCVEKFMMKKHSETKWSMLDSLSVKAVDSGIVLAVSYLWGEEQQEESQTSTPWCQPLPLPGWWWSDHGSLFTSTLLSGCLVTSSYTHPWGHPPATPPCSLSTHLTAQCNRWNTHTPRPKDNHQKPFFLCKNIKQRTLQPVNGGWGLIAVLISCVVGPLELPQCCLQCQNHDWQYLPCFTPQEASRWCPSANQDKTLELFTDQGYFEDQEKEREVTKPRLLKVDHWLNLEKEKKTLTNVKVNRVLEWHCSAVTCFIIVHCSTSAFLVQSLERKQSTFTII